MALNGIPSKSDIDKVQKEILAISTTKIVLSSHIVLNDISKSQSVKKKNKFCRKVRGFCLGRLYRQVIRFSKMKRRFRKMNRRFILLKRRNNFEEQCFVL